MSAPAPVVSRSVLLWLYAICALIVAMAIIGAVTRLTESGLSIVEWRVVMDMLPPLSEARWLEEFAKYKATPEYIHKNAGMSLDDFKNIYFWEWLHRLWGRLIGLAYVLPLMYFWVRGRIPSVLKPRFIGLLALGGLQGAIGWYMVVSGLVNAPRVSHYRLALHLGTALLLLSLLWAQALSLTPAVRSWRARYGIMLHPYKPHLFAALALVIVTMVWGAFVAGLDAGMIYNEFPTMGGKWIPGEFLFEKPWWQNFLTNHATVQWLHRVLGTAAFVLVFALGWRLIRQPVPGIQRLGYTLAGVITLQFMLGIITLLTHVAIVPAALHQLGAILVLMGLVALVVLGRSSSTAR